MKKRISFLKMLCILMVFSLMLFFVSCEKTEEPTLALTPEITLEPTQEATVPEVTPEKVYTKEDLEIKEEGAFLKWKFKDTSEWKNLIEISVLQQNSEEVLEFKIGDKFIEWKNIDSLEWNKLIENDTLLNQNFGCDHTWGSWISKINSTCSSIGYKIRTCTNCLSIDYSFSEKK